MNDLAYTPPKPSKAEMAAPMSSDTDEDGEQKPQYPTLRFNGHQAEKAKLKDCKFGEEYEITVRIRTTTIGGNSWERGSEDKPAVECEVLSSSDPKEVETSEDEEKEPDEPKKPERKPKSRVVGPEKEWQEEYK